MQNSLLTISLFALAFFLAFGVVSFLMITVHAQSLADIYNTTPNNITPTDTNTQGVTTPGLPNTGGGAASN